MRAFLRGATASAAETSSSSSSSSSSASSAKDSSNSSLANVFLRPPTARSRAPLSLRVATSESTLTFWETTVLPACKRWGIHPAGLRLACCGHMIPVDAHTTLSALGVGHLSTVDVVGQLPSQGFAQLHQLVEHLHEMLAPVGPANTSPPAVEESSSSREPIMHAIDAEIKRGSSSRADAQRFCSCLSCTRRPHSTLWLCGALLHSPDAAVVNITFRVVQLMLHASVDCPAPLVYFDEESGAITLGAREAEYGHVFEAVQEALTPEGVAIASLLSQRLVMLPLTPLCRVSRPSPAAIIAAHVARPACFAPTCSHRYLPSRILSTASSQAYDAKTHPLLWQHPSKKQTLLEIAARSSWPALLRSLLPALNLSRLAGSGALSAGACGASLLPRADLPSHPACLPVSSIPSPSPA